MDYYKTLGLRRKASRKEIRDAYRKLARQLHPDLNPGEKAAEKFKKVNEAYEVLNDPVKRKNYDDFGSNWKHAEQMRQSGFGGGGRSRQTGDFSLNDLLGGFGDMFGFGRSATRQQQQTGEVNAQVTIRLEEAYTGTTRDVAVNTDNGKRVIRAKIPRGIADNTRIALRPSGLTINLRVNIARHKVFTREGDDLRLQVKLPLGVALMGGEVTVPTLSKPVSLTIPANTQNGRTFRLRGRGMAVLRAERFGDLFVEVAVELPVPLSERDADLFKRMSFLDKSNKNAEV